MDTSLLYLNQNEHCIKIPREALNNLHLANKKQLNILLQIAAADPNHIDLKQLSDITGYDEEDILDAISFWEYTGAIREKESDFQKVVQNRLEKILNRPVQPYEQDILMNTYKNSKLTESQFLSLFDLANEVNKKNVNWINSVARICSTSEDIDWTIVTIRKYFSLMGLLIEDLMIERSLTSTEKKIIMEWANRRIPIESIYAAYEQSMKYLKRISFNYMEKILKDLSTEHGVANDTGY